MTNLLLAISVAMGLFLTWSVGVNTFGSTIGISLGSTRIQKQTAIIFSSIAAVLGVALLSNRVVDTVSRDLIAKLNISGLISVLIAIAIIATIISYRGIPISTTYAIIGALSGYILIAEIGINFSVLGKIISALFLSPFAALLIAFALFYLMKTFVLPKNSGIRKVETFEMKFFLPGFIALMILTFALGANSIGVVIGLLGNEFSFPVLVLIGSAGLILGIITWGSKTAQRLGVELADLSPSRGFVAMLSAGAIMIVFVSMGIPVSTTQTLIGAVVGVGLARKNVNARQALKVSLSWLIILPAALTIISMLVAALIGFVL